MQALESQISDAEQIFARVHAEEQARSELIDLADVIEEEAYSGLRTRLRDIDQLAAKIAERGQLVPILVWLRRGQYVLLSGHRRVAALRSLGATTVNAIVYGDRDLSEADALAIAIDDNIDRNNFNKAELAALVAKMVEQGHTQRKIAQRLRLGRGSVSDYFRLHAAPADIVAAVESETLAVRAGLRLAKEPGEVRARVLSQATGGLMSLRDVESLLAEAPAEAPVARAEAPRKRARRGGAWSRSKSLVGGLAWQRDRDGERELRIRVPANPTDEQRVALRKLLLDQVRSL